VPSPIVYVVDSCAVNISQRPTEKAVKSTEDPPSETVGDRNENAGGAP